MAKLALLSVSDKRGLAEFAAVLVRPVGRFARWAIGDDMVVHR
jgi:AICAR transformylase/IMP cyclohydrolase PurH